MGSGAANREAKGRCAACVLLAAAALAPVPASAQQDVARQRAEILDPMTVENEADMDFGDIVPGNSNGTVIMTPSATATCTANNGIVRTGTCRAARFDGDVSFLYSLRVTKPAGGQINLVGPAGATMALRNLTFGSGGGMLVLGSTANEHRYLILNVDGSFTVYVGGTLNVARNQRPGVYNGTFALTFNYD